MPPTKKEVAVGFISAAVIFFVLFFAGISLLDDPLLRQSVAFSRTAHYILADYHLPVMRAPAFNAAENNLLELLDPFSQLMDKRDYLQMREEYSGEYSGIGVTIIPRDSLLMVISVHEGGPAYDGGVRSGDWILAVDGHNVPHDNPSSATDYIRGQSGTPVKLTIYRPRIDETLHLTLTRGAIKLEHIPYYGMTETGMAYIRLADFEAGAAEQLQEAVEILESKNPRGYILDLKGNPGGYLGEAVEAADIFLNKGVLIVGIDSRSRWDNRQYKSTSKPLTDRPLVVLTDRGTASGAEILTGALHAAERAVVVGDTTFGKGLVQSVFSLANGDAMRLTISRYYFADGRYLNPPDSVLHFVGLAPDIVYSPPGELAFQDLILSGLLLYDFADEYWPLLSGYPDKFGYPDTVITLFEEFARSRGIEYQSWMTQTLNQTLQYQHADSAGPAVLAQLDSMLALSQALDRDALERHADFLKFQIRRVVVERKDGRAASYRDVIVPGRTDIRFVEQLLADSTRYDSYLTARPDTE